MGEANRWPLEMAGVPHRGVALEAFSFRRRWPPMMLVRLLGANKPTPNDEGVRMVMVVHHQGILMVIGDSKLETNHNFRNNSLQWVILGRT